MRPVCHTDYLGISFGLHVMFLHGFNLYDSQLLRKYESIYKLLNLLTILTGLTATVKNLHCYHFMLIRMATNKNMKNNNC